ncbi:hypothetical protein SLS58_004401 [Diplodia intermedia]|uniref:Rhodopsin domain-containing protein n=1 Tax=Diplodia intermedia TaxID=856260 RepID=A0ABR3TUL1_9PEZI
MLTGSRHVELVSSENLKKIRLYELIEQFCYLFVHLFLKLSFLLYFYRTLYTPRLSTAIRITAAIVVVQTVASWIFYALQCRPLGAYVDPEDYPDATCYPDGVAYYAPVAVNVATIILVYILPIPTLIQRSPPPRQPTTTPPPPSTPSTPTPNDDDPERPSPPQPQQEGSQPPSSPPRSSSSRSTLAAFLLAGGGVVVSGLRVVAQYQQAVATSSASYSRPASNDRTYNLAPLAMATAVELGVYAVVANDVPGSVRALLFPRAGRSSSAAAGSVAHELHDRRGGRRTWRWGRRRRRDGGAETDEDELWGEGGEEAGGKITITSRVSISITEALRVKDGPAHYPKKYFKFARPGAQSPTPNFLKDV